MLGHICKSNEYHPGHQLTAEKIDQMIGELRRYAPEMPGIGFYGWGVRRWPWTVTAWPTNILSPRPPMF
ncbi:MAG: hypothetical protein CM1200mP2_59150 [Planctomycetaceae bacterium]|nr:MAG: hypothetical protein CM1200mP2_59150 [Planctomycetaceae bacterium]